MLSLDLGIASVIVVYMVIIHVIVENYVYRFFIFRIELIMSILESNDITGNKVAYLKFIFVRLLSPNLWEHVVLIFLFFTIHIFLLQKHY